MIICFVICAMASVAMGAPNALQRRHDQSLRHRRSQGARQSSAGSSQKGFEVALSRDVAGAAGVELVVQEAAVGDAVEALGGAS